MCVYGCEKRCADAVMLVLVVWDMGACSVITVFFGKAKVNDIDEMGGLMSAHDEICRLYVAMDEPIRVNKLSSEELKMEKTLVSQK